MQRRLGWSAIACASLGFLVALLWAGAAQVNAVSDLDTRLADALAAAGFTGNIESTLPRRLGRPVNRELADLGRLVFFDNINGLHDDNSCAGCHAPAFGFGDSQSMAIGVDSNRIVGPNRTGPRNQRKAPIVVNSGFFRRLMLNGRFEALSGDPFNNAAGFLFPPPEGVTRFASEATLLAAQGQIPQTELVEMAGFTGTKGTIGSAFDQFDDGHGSRLPPADSTGTRNEPIRTVVQARFNDVAEYRRLFGEIFNGGKPFARGGVTISMIGRALAEFQISLTFANAPIDRFARGQRSAMTDQQKRGALLFFGDAKCVTCHAVAGNANEMFSDFENRAIGVPQIAPLFGVGSGNVVFDGPNRDEDFGAEQISGRRADRYKFRTSPIRNVAVQPAFFHNGAFTSLADAIRHHLDARESAGSYNPYTAGVDTDLTHVADVKPVLQALDPALRKIKLNGDEFADLLAFVRDGLLDPRARPQELCRLIPATVPSGRPVLFFEGCGAR